MPGGFFARIGRKLAGKKAAAPTPRSAAPSPAPPAAEQPEVRPQTGGAPAPPPSEEFIENSIYDTGAAGEIGEVEGATLAGRMSPRRNINLDFFNDDSTKATIEYFNRSIDGAQHLPKRQVVSHQETLSRSLTGSKNIEDLEGRIERITGSRLDEKWEPEDLVSIYQLMEGQAVEMREYAMKLKAEKAAGVQTSSEDLAHYQLLATRFTATQEIASTRAAEAGRMLNALQAVSKSAGSRQYYKDLQEVIHGAGGEDNIWQSIDNVADARGVKEIAAAARQGWGAKLYHTAVQVRYNAMLSSVRTHAANVLGSAMTGVYETGIVNPTRVLLNNAEYAGRALLQAATGAGGMDRNSRIALSEIVDLPLAMVRSIGRGITNFGKVYRGETLGHGKIYNELGIRTLDKEMQGAGMLPRGLQIPTRLLEAEDAFFRSIYGNAQLEVLARRKALAEATSDAEVDQLFDNYMRSPTDDMQAEAFDFASRLTFTNDPSFYGEVMHTLARIGSSVQNTGFGRLLLPFVRTPANILGYTLDNTAVGKFMAPRKLYQELTGNDPEARADAAARMAIAAGLYVYLRQYWEDGRITGAAPGNYSVYRAREAMGWRANSIRIGDEYYELSRMDPFGLVLATYATAYDVGAHLTEEDLPTAAAASIVTVASMLTDRSFLSGLGDLERVFQASEGSVGKQAGRMAGRMATSFFVPGMVRDIREAADPYQRSLDVPDTLGGALWATVVKTTQNAVPWWSENVPPGVDAFGKDRINPGSSFWRATVPMRRGEIQQDPAAAALAATGTPVNKPDYLIKPTTIGGTPPLDLLAMDGGQGWVYRKYQQYVGAMRHDMVKRYVNSKSWKDAVAIGAVTPDSVYADQLRSTLNKARRLATLAFVKDIEGLKTIRPKVGDSYPVGEITVQHVFTREQYKALARALAEQGPTGELVERGAKMGVKIKRKPEQRGLPEEMRF